MNVVPLHDPDAWREAKAAELGLSVRELNMVQAFEMIATGTVGEGAETDLEVVRDIALDALEKIGWPTAKKRNPRHRSTGG